MSRNHGGGPHTEATLFDVDEYRAEDHAHRHGVAPATNGLTPTERLLNGALPAATSLRCNGWAGMRVIDPRDSHRPYGLMRRCRRG